MINYTLAGVVDAGRVMSGVVLLAAQERQMRDVSIESMKDSRARGYARGWTGREGVRRSIRSDKVQAR